MYLVKIWPPLFPSHYFLGKGKNHNPRAGYENQQTSRYEIKGVGTASVVPVSPERVPFQRYNDCLGKRKLALLHYDCEKSLDLSLPWERLLSISVMDDEKSMVARENFGFRYVHWALLEFQGDGEIVEICLHCPEARQYELALEEIPLLGADSLVPYFKLDETDFLSDVEIVLDADDRAYSLTIGSAQGKLVQIISGEFDNLYEEKFGCKKVKFIDEMMLFFPTRQYSKADFESSCVTNSFSVKRRVFDQPNTK